MRPPKGPPGVPAPRSHFQFPSWRAAVNLRRPSAAGQSLPFTLVALSLPGGPACRIPRGPVSSLRPRLSAICAPSLLRGLARPPACSATGWPWSTGRASGWSRHLPGGPAVNRLPALCSLLSRDPRMPGLHVGAAPAPALSVRDLDQAVRHGPGQTHHVPQEGTGEAPARYFLTGTSAESQTPPGLRDPGVVLGCLF